MLRAPRLPSSSPAPRRVGARAVSRRRVLLSFFICHLGRFLAVSFFPSATLVLAGPRSSCPYPAPFRRHALPAPAPGNMMCCENRPCANLMHQVEMNVVWCLVSAATVPNAAASMGECPGASHPSRFVVVENTICQNRRLCFWAASIFGCDPW